MSEVQRMRCSSETAEEKETIHRRMREAQSERRAGETEEESGARRCQMREVYSARRIQARCPSHGRCQNFLGKYALEYNIRARRLLFPACITNTVTAWRFLRLAPQCFAFTSNVKLLQCVLRDLRNLATGSKSLVSRYLGYRLCDIKLCTILVRNLGNDYPQWEPMARLHKSAVL